VCTWNISLKEYAVERNAWLTLSLPVPKHAYGKKIDMFSVVYENWIDKQSSGSLEMAHPTFISDSQKLNREKDAIIHLFSQSAEAAHYSCMNLLREQKIASGGGVVFERKGKDKGIGITAKKQGWIGTSAYPSIRLPEDDGIIIIRAKATSAEPFSGTIEFKNNTDILFSAFFSNHSMIPSHNGEVIAMLPIHTADPEKLVNYFAISHLNGSFSLIDIEIRQHSA